MTYAMVDVILTGVAGREQMARALRRFAGLSAEFAGPALARAAE
jgi:hypothetical protein